MNGREAKLLALESIAPEAVEEPFPVDEEVSFAPPIPAEAIRHWSTPRTRPYPRVAWASRRRETRVLPAEPLLFGWLGERLSPGEATVWLGPREAIEPLLESVYVGCALTGGRVSLVEGANRFQPYRIGERGRGAGVDPGKLLERIRLARAFTAYQLVALVDAWSNEARRHRPTLLVAHELPEMFFTDEVPERERAPLLEHVAATLGDVAKSTGVPLLVTVAGGWDRFPGLGTVGPRLFDLLRLRVGSGVLHMDAYRDGRRLRIVPRPRGQHGLEEYGPDVGAGEVTTWVGPSRRTGRRSRSG